MAAPATSFPGIGSVPNPAPWGCWRWEELSSLGPSRLPVGRRNSDLMNTKIYSFNQERDQGWSVVFDATEGHVQHDGRASLTVPVRDHASPAGPGAVEVTRRRQDLQGGETSLFLELSSFLQLIMGRLLSSWAGPVHPLGIHYI